MPKPRSTPEEKQGEAGLSSNCSDSETGQTNFRFVDLFAGIGGFHFGLKAAGGQCVFSNEWDKYAAKTYASWTGADDVNTEDIRTLDFVREIPDHDILAGGFPCQPFSIAGVSKKNSLGREHGFGDIDQGNLFFAICDLAKAKRPPIMILENVKNLKSHDKGRTWAVINDALDALGYEVRSKVIDARFWVPQHRERIFIVCFDRKKFRKREIDTFTFPEAPSDGPKLSAILDPNPPEKYMISDRLWTYLQNYAEKHRLRGNGFGFQLVDGTSISRTMSARYYKDGSEILVAQPGWRNPRRLTPAEAALLMGFTPRYASLAGHEEGFPQVVSDMQAYKQFGNSVSPLVVEALALEAVRVLELRSIRLSQASLARQ